MSRSKFIKLTTDIGEGIISIPSIVKTKSKYFAHILDPKIVRNQNNKTIHIFGGSRILKLPAKYLNDLFTPTKKEIQPGQGVPLHLHKNEDEVFKVLEGEMELRAGNKTTVLKAGDVAFGPKGVLHSCKIIGNKKAKVILHELPEGNEEIFEELNELTDGPSNFKVLSDICGRYGISFIS